MLLTKVVLSKDTFVIEIALHKFGYSLLERSRGVLVIVSGSPIKLEGMDSLVLSVDARCSSALM